jgi:hypothetical protein
MKLSRAIIGIVSVFGMIGGMLQTDAFYMLFSFLYGAMVLNYLYKTGHVN